MSYNAFIARIKDVKMHSNADRLKVGTVFGNNVIVGLDTQENDLICYFPTDGKLGEEYAIENKLLRTKDENGNNTGGYLDPAKRNITALKLRGERSDGLVMKLESLSKFTKVSELKEGDMITVLNGVVICEKYIPYKKPRNPDPSQKTKRKKVEEKEFFPLFQEHIDTAHFAYNTHQFKIGDDVTISLKIHGTSQRTSHTIKEEKKVGWIGKIVKFLKLKPKKSWDYVTGTRRVTLKTFDGGFYGSNSFRQQWHDAFVGKLHKGESCFYEVVGFTDNGSLIMGECDNKKTKDKEFIKQWGDKTQFTYGCNYGQSDIYIYRMTMTNEDGFTVEYPSNLVKLRAEQMGIKVCPELDRFKFTTLEDLLERVERYTDGADPIGMTHIREGIIIRIENKEKFTVFKNKSFDFKVLESIIKVDAEEPDMEEREGLNDEEGN